MIRLMDDIPSLFAQDDQILAHAYTSARNALNFIAKVDPSSVDNPTSSRGKGWSGRRESNPRL
jgi:hypothetical protein